MTLKYFLQICGESPVLFWPVLWVQLAHYHAWMHRESARLGERVQVQILIRGPWMYLVRMSDNLSGRAKPNPFRTESKVTFETLCEGHTPAYLVFSVVCENIGATAASVLCATNPEVTDACLPLP